VVWLNIILTRSVLLTLYNESKLISADGNGDDAMQVITALAHLWHPEHFVCVHCKESLGTRNFFERDNQPYCERDYHLLFSPRCAFCSGPILDVRVTSPIALHFCVFVFC